MTLHEINEARLKQSAQESPAGEAKAQFAKLAADCAAAETLFQTQHYGPFNISGHCTHSCGFKKWSWSFHGDYTAWVPFTAYIGNVSALDGQFNAAFSPAQTLNQALNTLQSDVTGSIETIIQIDQTIIGAGGTVTPEQKTQLDAAFSTISQKVSESLSACTNALQSMSRFGSRTPQMIGYLKKQADNRQSAIDQDINKNRDNLLARAPCGSGTVRSRIDNFESSINNNIAALKTKFTAIDAVLRDGVRAVGQIAGVLLVMQTHLYPGISEAAEEAQSLEPTSINRQIKLTIAIEDINDLLDYAHSHLS